MFACATEAAKRPYKKISSCAVDTDEKGVKRVRSAIKVCSYKLSYNESNDIYVKEDTLDKKINQYFVME